MMGTVLSIFLKYTGIMLILMEFLPRPSVSRFAPIALGLALITFALLFLPMDPAYSALDFKSIMFGFGQSQNLSPDQTWAFALAPPLGAALGAFLWKFLKDRSLF